MRYLAYLSYAVGLRLKAAGGHYFYDNKLTFADLKAYVLVKSLMSGNLDHVPVDLCKHVAPNLIKHIARIEVEPGFQQHFFYW
jgi:glutathione S-transferase